MEDQLKWMSTTKLSYLVFIFAIILFASCRTKLPKVATSAATNTPPHQLKGMYIGKGYVHSGAYTTTTYELLENNFAIGRLTPGGPPVTFGGYRINGDSIFMSVYYTSNKNYYLLSGELSNHDSTISGSTKNLNNPDDFGFFTISKQ